MDNPDAVRQAPPARALDPPKCGRSVTMCNLFVSQDPASYAAETRPIRLHGHATSIRLEAAFWDILA